MNSDLAPLERLLRDHARAKIAVLGIGNLLNADDGAGILAAQLLRGQVNSGRQDWLVIEAGQSPEAFTGPLRRFTPALVILIDAAELGEPPGALRVFDWSEAVGMSASTHTLPPSVLAQYLVAELGCQVALVGIQPRSLDFDVPLSADVRQAVQAVVDEIANHL